MLPSAAPYEQKRINEHDGETDRRNDERRAQRHLCQPEVRIPFRRESGNELAPNAVRVADDARHPGRDDRPAENRHDKA